MEISLQSTGHCIGYSKLYSYHPVRHFRDPRALLKLFLSFIVEMLSLYPFLCQGPRLWYLCSATVQHLYYILMSSITALGPCCDA